MPKALSCTALCCTYIIALLSLCAHLLYTFTQCIISKNCTTCFQKSTSHHVGEVRFCSKWHGTVWFGEEKKVWLGEEKSAVRWRRRIMECLRDVSWDYKGAGGIDTAATIGGGVQTETNLLIIIIIRNGMKFVMGLLIQVNYQVGGWEWYFHGIFYLYEMPFQIVSFINYSVESK